MVLQSQALALLNVAVIAVVLEKNAPMFFHKFSSILAAGSVHWVSQVISTCAQNSPSILTMAADHWKASHRIFSYFMARSNDQAFWRSMPDSVTSHSRTAREIFDISAHRIPCLTHHRTTSKLEREHAAIRSLYQAGEWVQARASLTSLFLSSYDFSLDMFITMIAYFTADRSLKDLIVDMDSYLDIATYLKAAMQHHNDMIDTALFRNEAAMRDPYKLKDATTLTCCLAWGVDVIFPMRLPLVIGVSTSILNVYHEAINAVKTGQRFIDRHVNNPVASEYADAYASTDMSFALLRKKYLVISAVIAQAIFKRLPEMIAARSSQFDIRFLYNLYFMCISFFDVLWADDLFTFDHASVHDKLMRDARRVKLSSLRARYQKGGSSLQFSPERICVSTAAFPLYGEVSKAIHDMLGEPEWERSGNQVSDIYKTLVGPHASPSSRRWPSAHTGVAGARPINAAIIAGMAETIASATAMTNATDVEAAQDEVRMYAPDEKYNRAGRYKKFVDMCTSRDQLKRMEVCDLLRDDYDADTASSRRKINYQGEVIQSLVLKAVDAARKIYMKRPVVVSPTAERPWRNWIPWVKKTDKPVSSSTRQASPRQVNAGVAAGSLIHTSHMRHPEQKQKRMWHWVSATEKPDEEPYDPRSVFDKVKGKFDQVNEVLAGRRATCDAMVDKLEEADVLVASKNQTAFDLADAMSVRLLQTPYSHKADIIDWLNTGLSTFSEANFVYFLPDPMAYKHGSAAPEDDDGTKTPWWHIGHDMASDTAKLMRRVDVRRTEKSKAYYEQGHVRGQSELTLLMHVPLSVLPTPDAPKGPLIRFVTAKVQALENAFNQHAAHMHAGYMTRTLRVDSRNTQQVDGVQQTQAEQVADPAEQVDLRLLHIHSNVFDLPQIHVGDSATMSRSWHVVTVRPTRVVTDLSSNSYELQQMHLNRDDAGSSQMESLSPGNTHDQVRPVRRSGPSIRSRPTKITHVPATSSGVDTHGDVRSSRNRTVRAASTRSPQVSTHRARQSASRSGTAHGRHADLQAPPMRTPMMSSSRYPPGVIRHTLG